MASIIERNGKFSVVYNYFDENGKKKQKWETYDNIAKAKKRRKEIEFHKFDGTFVVPNCKTLEDLLKEYVNLYGRINWSASTYQGNVSLIDNYIIPILGKMKICDINTRVIDKYYQQLLRTKAMKRKYFGKEAPGETDFISEHTVRDVNKILRSCFKQAVKWELIERNPCINATVPKAKYKEREIWTAQDIIHALEVCKDDRLKLAINLAFSCSLRIGEMLGLTWDAIDISKDSIEAGTASIYIDKELQRASRSVLITLENKDVITVFPTLSNKTLTQQVLKKPKTDSSIRKVFLPASVAEMLLAWKASQDENIELLGEEYNNYGLVFANPFGNPLEQSVITNALKRLIKDNDLPPVVFHSLRHSSITYKLKLNGGDIKAVQGDSGHSQAQMVTDRYSHIIDENRANNARLMEENFYKRSSAPIIPPEETKTAEISDINPDLLKTLIENPSIIELLKTLSAKQ